MMEQPFVHWVMYNIPASASGLPAGLPSDATLEMNGLEGAVNGLNGLRRPAILVLARPQTVSSMPIISACMHWMTP